MNRLGVIKVSHEMVDSIELLTPWKEQLDFYFVKTLIKESPYKIDSFIFLSTCNRVEIIYKIHDPSMHLLFYDYITNVLPQLSFQPEFITGRPVIVHLLKLASGLESMVIGETEIRHQLKEAFKQSIEEGCIDSLFNQLFQSVFRESKEIRKYIPTNLPLSISSIAIRKLEDIVGGFASRDEYFIVIGSGTISKSSIEYIKKWGGRNILWINRTKEKIIDYAKALHVEALSLKEFFDIKTFQNQYPKNICAIITATSSTQPLLRKEFVKQLNYKKLFIVDLAIPSDVEEEVHELEYVSVINLQTIKEQLERNKKRREELVKTALNMIEESSFRVETNWITSISSHVLTEIQSKIYQHSQKRLNELLEGHLRHLSNKDKRIILDWARKYHREIHRFHRVSLEKLLFQYHKISNNKN